MEANEMATYGPNSFSLHDRVAVADAIFRVDRAELIQTSIDDLALEPRELGHFELHVAAVLVGQPRESVRVVVARGRDGRWPIPSDARLVAFVQSGRPLREWTLVHNSAFALDRGGFRFSPTTGCDGGGKATERVSLRELERMIARLAKEREAHMRLLETLEPDSKKGRWFGEMEMPDSTLTSLQRQAGEGGGRASMPRGSVTSPRPRRKR
jgi:hypothetical protein